VLQYTGIKKKSLEMLAKEEKPVTEIRRIIVADSDDPERATLADDIEQFLITCKDEPQPIQ
jgi:hypothetical protein